MWFYGVCFALICAFAVGIIGVEAYHNGWQAGFHLRDDAYQRGLDMGRQIWECRR